MDKLNDIKKHVSVTFEYDGEQYTLDISKELSINTNLLNDSLKNSPSSYAFLCLVRDTYLKKKETLERERDLSYAQIWIYFKEAYPKWNNEFTNQKTISSSKYQSICKELESITYIYDTISSICKAFESRERILQTLSANLRKQS